MVEMNESIYFQLQYYYVRKWVLVDMANAAKLFLSIHAVYILNAYQFSFLCYVLMTANAIKKQTNMRSGMVCRLLLEDQGVLYISAVI